MLCVLILYMSGATCSRMPHAESTPKPRFLRNFSRQFYLLSELLPEIYWEEAAEEILFVLRFLGLAWGSNLGFSSNKSNKMLFQNIFYLLLEILPDIWWAEIAWEIFCYNPLC